MEKLPGAPLQVRLEQLPEQEQQQLRANVAPQLRSWLAALAAVPRPPGSCGPLAALRVADDGSVAADGPGWFHHELPPLGLESCTGFAALTSAVLQDCIARLQAEPDSREAADQALRAVKDPDDEALQAILRHWRATPLKGDHADRLKWCEIFQAMLGDVEAYRASHEPDGLPEQYTRLTHNDLCGNNLLVDEGGQLVGVIDWESAMMGLTDKDCEEYGEVCYSFSTFSVYCSWVVVRF